MNKKKILSLGIWVFTVYLIGMVAVINIALFHSWGAIVPLVGKAGLFPFALALVIVIFQFLLRFAALPLVIFGLLMVVQYKRGKLR